MFLSQTNESQGHGKPWETNILEQLVQKERLSKYTHTAIYDAKKEDLINNLLCCSQPRPLRNLSIKVTKSDTIYCGDVIRFLVESKDVDIITITYNQINKKIKKAKNTILINHDLLIQKLKEDIPKIFNITFEEWILKIKDYVERVKSIPHGKCVNKWYREEVKGICKDIPYFRVHPKVDSKSQRRVQCSINLKNIPIEEEYEGGKFRNITYIKEIISSPRKRNLK